MKLKTENPLLLKKRERFLLKIEPDKQFDLPAMFGNNNPVLIEIGSGKGEFISQYALLHPEQNFIGFEVRQKRIDIILRKLDLKQHNNVRLATFLIDVGIENIIPPKSIHGVFIQHPDPWPKRKHFKRRLVQQAFLDALSKIIRPGGFIQVSTDHEEYALWIWKEFSKRTDFLPKNVDKISTKPLLDEHIETFYEREQRRLGFEPKHMLFEKCPE
ncbi:MAG: tRNA (guanosine(46)-N7)-methyltransferase TrmB [Candidatus Cloacimonadaceae bacterium]